MEPQSATRWTYEDYAALPDDGKRYEILDGELFVTPSPLAWHQQISMNLTLALGMHVRAHKLGQLFYAPFDVVLSRTDVVQPDILFISAARAEIITRANVQGAPDLVIEVLSDGTRRNDEIQKRNAYDRFGVAEYWIVDPELELMTIYRRDADGFRRVAEVENGPHGVITTPLLPGLSLPIRDVFQR